MSKMSDKELEEKLREFFESNYQVLKESSGHTINENMKERAFEQVLMYWRKHKEMVLDGDVSNVKITLSNQQTPNKKNPYSIEGRLDVLEKDGKISLFDVTTNSKEQIEDSIDSYREELNLFAYELERMQQGTVDDTFVLSTSIPRDVKHALKTNNAVELGHALENWDPVVPIQHDASTQEAALKKVGEVIEKINNCEFDPPPPSTLQKKFKDDKTFYQHVCENCDIRKSCESFRTQHLKLSSH